MPVKELLLALARDTKQNIDIHPGVERAGQPERDQRNAAGDPRARLQAGQHALPRRGQHDRRVARYAVREDLPRQLRQHDARHDLDASACRARSCGSRGGGAGGRGRRCAAAAAVQAPAARARSCAPTSKNDFWEQLRDNIRSILNSTRLQSLTADARAERLALVKQEQELRVKQTGGGEPRRPGRAALATSRSTRRPAARQQQSTLLPDDVVVNPVAGTVTVNATEQQHQLVQQHIDSIVNVMQRQVLIEATIVEVSLSETLPGGRRLEPARRSAAGSSFAQSLIRRHRALAAAPVLPLGYVNPNTARLGNISADRQAARAVRQHARAVEPEADGAQQPDRAAQGGGQRRLLRGQLVRPRQATDGSVLQTFTTTAKTVAVGRRDERDAADQRGRPRHADGAADDHAAAFRTAVRERSQSLRLARPS